MTPTKSDRFSGVKRHPLRSNQRLEGEQVRGAAAAPRGDMGGGPGPSWVARGAPTRPACGVAMGFRPGPNVLRPRARLGLPRLLRGRRMAGPPCGHTAAATFSPDTASGNGAWFLIPLYEIQIFKEKENFEVTVPVGTNEPAQGLTAAPRALWLRVCGRRRDPVTWRDHSGGSLTGPAAARTAAATLSTTVIFIQSPDAPLLLQKPACDPKSPPE